MVASENELIRLSVEGNVESFEELVRTHQKGVYNIALRYFDREDAMDMSQEVFIKIFKNLQNFRMDSSFKTYIYTIAVNTCRDELRKRKIRQDAIGGGLTEEDGSNIGDNSYNPAIAYEKKELAKLIEEALKKLPEQNRSVVMLRDMLGHSYDEISEIENCPVGTVKSRIKRGREQLRNLITNENILFYSDRKEGSI